MNFLGPDKNSLSIAKEYEDFAYIVSHDLNAPLRHIKQFAKLLVDSRAAPLNEDEKEYVDYLEGALDKIERMQDALLTFSRLNTKSKEHHKIECNGLLVNVLQSMDKDLSIIDPPPSIDVHSLPYVMGDPKQLHCLFFNLIDNAIRFHKINSDIRVTITAKQKGKFHLFEIKDNGIGIHADYHQEVFRFFRRLNLAPYQGIGAGLSICRKIVQRHNGEIWIESVQDQGASVLFTLPTA